MVADQPTKTCERCGAPRRYWAPRFCSRACSAAAHRKPRLACERCGQPVPLANVIYCSNACSYAARTGDVAERLWAKVDKTETCWLWIGCRNVSGYGHFSIRRRAFPAHRIAYELTFGPIPDGLDVCHHCDNPPCVRPDHLFLGTRADNLNDMYRKGRRSAGERHSAALRAALPRGSQHHHHKLTDDQVRIIKAESVAGVTRAALAKRFGVDRSAIVKVARGLAWKHVT